MGFGELADPATAQHPVASIADDSLPRRDTVDRLLEFNLKTTVAQQAGPGRLTTGVVAYLGLALETGLSVEQQNNDEPDTALLVDNSFTPSTVVNEQDSEQRTISDESLPSGHRKRLSDWLFNWYRNRS